MNQKLSIEEIINSKELKTPEKIKMLYLDHELNYEDIADLLNLRVSTVQYNISMGKYCRAKKTRPPVYGDVRTRIRELLTENPDLTRAEVAEKIGCSVSNVAKYVRETGLQFKAHSGGKGKPRKPKAPKEKKPKEIVEIVPEEKKEVKPLVEEIPQEISQESKEDLIEENPIHEEFVEDASPTIEKMVTEVSEPEDDDSDDPPYEIMDYPMVIYKGRLYEIMDRRELRKALRASLNIKPAKKKKRV